MDVVVRRMLLIGDASTDVSLPKRLREKGWAVQLASELQGALNLWHGQAYDAVVLKLNDARLAWRLMQALAAMQPCSALRSPAYLISGRPPAQLDEMEMLGTRWLPSAVTVEELATALSSRGRSNQQGPLRRIGVLEVDALRQRAYIKERAVTLRAKELALLVLLMDRAGDWVALGDIQAVLDCKGGAVRNTIAVHLCRLRSALNDRPRPRLIQSRRNRGYRLNPAPLQATGGS